MERRNCWEVMNCGRQTGGENVNNLGGCSAALSNEYDSVNRGSHGGRFCWVISGTGFKGEGSCTYARKIKSCLNCKFLKQVNEEEGRFFILTPTDAKDTSRRVV
jgi:hypothetical protein